MSASITSGKECVRAWEAMPAVLLEHATADLREWLHQHLASCSACRKTFDQQKCLRRTLSLPRPGRLDPRLGFKRLLDRIDQSGGAAVPARLPSATDWLQRGLFAVVLIQAFALSVTAARFWLAGPAPLYRTLSQEPTLAVAGTIRVVPDAAMALTDWNALLHVLHLRVVGGPDTSGAYTVAAMNPKASTQHLLQQLRAAHGIKLAEALPGAR